MARWGESAFIAFSSLCLLVAACGSEPEPGVVAPRRAPSVGAAYGTGSSDSITSAMKSSVSAVSTR